MFPLTAAVSLTSFILHKNPSMIPKFRKLVPRLIKKMKVIISGGFKSEYNVGGVPDPFLQVEMLKLLCLLATNDHDSSDMLGDLLAFVDVSSLSHADRYQDRQLLHGGQRGAL